MAERIIAGNSAPDGGSMRAESAPRATVAAPHNLSGKGSVYSYSIMYSAPGNYEEQMPYAIALVQLDDGPMLTAQLTDINNEDVQIGMRVEMVTRKLREDGAEGQIIYGFKFRPLLKVISNSSNQQQQ